MRAIDFLYEHQRLDEVAMSPGKLSSLAKAVGATAGMEFEMIVPDMENPDEDTEYENDMNSDERASSWGGIEDFFMGGDGNNYRPDVRRMIEKLQEDYWEWVNEVVWERWSNEGREYFFNEIEDEFDEDAAREEALDELAGDDPEISPDDDRVDELVKQKKQEWLESEWDNEGVNYEHARENFEEDERNSIDEGDWLDENYRWMSDIWENFGSDNDVYWPYQVPIGGGEGELADLADDFSRAIGRGVNASTTYHGVRNDNEYTIEPDGSLDPDDSDDAGLEFVSPPLPLDQMISDLQKTIAWAQSRGCYTNNSTGLHMNVSVPSYRSDKLDYVKLAILLGDEYVLQQFGRQGNTYTKSAMAKVRANIGNNGERTQEFLQQMRAGLTKVASDAIHNGYTDKYTSINTKTGYIEFRSPGGNWLDEDLGKLVATLNRFVVALDAACSPEKYKEEYYKKLYKLLSAGIEESYGEMINDFAMYTSGVGGAPQKVVSDFRRLALAALQASRGKETGDWWWNVAINSQRVEVVANSPKDAWEAAVTANPTWGRLSPNQAKITRLRPFTDNRPANGTSAQATVGEPQALNQPQQQRQYQIYRTDTGDAVTAFMAQDDYAALERLEQHRSRVPSQAQALYSVRRA